MARAQLSKLRSLIRLHLERFHRAGFIKPHGFDDLEFAARHEPAARGRALPIGNFSHIDFKRQSKMSEAVGDFMLELPVNCLNRRVSNCCACIKMAFPRGSGKFGHAA
jgi:hypothetical protein